MASYVATTAKQLGAVLRGFRRERGLTQQQLAARLGLAQKAISAAETHSDRVGVERLFQLLSVLDVELVLRNKTTAKPPRTEW